MGPEELPKTYGNVIPFNKFNFPVVVRYTDLWTIELRFAHMASICQNKILHYLVALRSDLTLLGFVSSIDYLAISSDEEISRNVRYLVDHLRAAIGWATPSTTRQSVVTRHERLMKERNSKSSPKRLKFVKNTPICSLIQILIDNDIRITKEMIAKLKSDSADQDLDILTKTIIIHNALSAQNRQTYCPIILLGAAKLRLLGLDEVYRYFCEPDEQSDDDVDVLIHTRPSKAVAKQTLILLSENFGRLIRVTSGTWPLSTWILLQSDDVSKIMSAWNFWLNEKMELIKDLNVSGECWTRYVRTVDDMGRGFQELVRQEL